MRSLSRILFVSGALLLGFWAIARLHALAGSAVALAQIPEPSTTTSSSVTTTDGSQVDTSLWAPKRIAQFEEALHIAGEPPMAILSVSRIGIRVPVFRGTDEMTLNRGAGWIESTPVPGTSGNAGIAGHRDGFFRPLKDIAVGDTIEMRTLHGIQTFVVQTLSVVDPSNVDVLAPTKEPALTLVTCWPFYYVGSAPKRFIVRAVRTSGPPPSQVSQTPDHDANVRPQ